MIVSERKGITVRHVGVVVKDLARSLQFYRDLLGFRVVKQMEESGAYLDSLLALKNARVTTVKLAPPRSGPGVPVIELLQFHSHADESPAPRTIYTIGPTHVAFTVDDLDALYQRLLQAGVRFNAPPQRSPDGSAAVCCCQDPDGMTVELVEAAR